jgi:hypothetical protein
MFILYYKPAFATSSELGKSLCVIGFFYISTLFIELSLTCYIILFKNAPTLESLKGICFRCVKVLGKTVCFIAGSQLFPGMPTHQ